MKKRRILRFTALGILIISTVYVVVSLISNPLGADVTMLALATTAGFIALGCDKGKPE